MGKETCGVNTRKRSVRDKADMTAASAEGSPPGGEQQVLLDATFLPGSFKSESEKIATDIVMYVVRGGDMHIPPPSNAAIVMRNLVKDTLQSRTTKMREMVLALEIKDRSQLQLLTSVADNMFDDDQVNWGRIVTLHAFYAYVAKYCEDKHLPECTACLDDVVGMLADFTVNRLGLWIVTHGGWRGFESQFPVVCFVAVGGVWKGLCIIALLFGATFLFYCSVRYMGGNNLF